MESTRTDQATAVAVLVKAGVLNVNDAREVLSIWGWRTMDIHHRDAKTPALHSSDAEFGRKAAG